MYSVCALAGCVETDISNALLFVPLPQGFTMGGGDWDSLPPRILKAHIVLLLKVATIQHFGTREATRSNLRSPKFCSPP